jgi:hypothetical protein
MTLRYRCHCRRRARIHSLLRDGSVRRTLRSSDFCYPRLCHRHRRRRRRRRRAAGRLSSWTLRLRGRRARSGTRSKAARPLRKSQAVAFVSSSRSRYRFAFRRLFVILLALGRVYFGHSRYRTGSYRHGNWRRTKTTDRSEACLRIIGIIHLPHISYPNIIDASPTSPFINRVYSFVPFYVSLRKERAGWVLFL